MLRISVNLIFCNSNYIIIYMKKTICSLFLILITVLLFAERPLVRNIQARATGGKKIRISWQLPEQPEPAIYNILIYRTTEQITSYSQLKGIEALATLPAEQTTYTDQIEDLRDYYYTVISRTEKGSYDLVMLSFNSTVTGVHLTAKKSAEQPDTKNDYETLYPDGTMRKTPLPYLDIVEGINAEPLVSDQTASKAKSLSGKSGKSSKSKNLTPYIFEEDLVSPDGGDAYLLFEILKTSFVTKKYRETIDKLNQLIGTNISEETRNRAYFYLGEAQYFNHNYEDAVRSFIKIQQTYPTISKKWLEASLDRI